MIKNIIVVVLIALSLSACKNDVAVSNNADNHKVNTEDLKAMSTLLSSIADKPQHFKVSGSKQSIVTGARGSKIAINPAALAFEDGTKVSGSIDVALIEILDNHSFALNNAQTVSDGKLLVSGGAYYINMTSAGKQLKIVDKAAVSVEFPKITDEEMSFFKGERDSANQMNWTLSGEKFIANVKPNPEQKKYYRQNIDELDAILEYVDSGYVKPQQPEKVEISKEEYDKYQKEKAEHRLRTDTYKSIEIINFGFINCDRFWNEIGPKSNIEMRVEDSLITTAQFYLVFKDIKSTMSDVFYKQQKTAAFQQIPSGKNVVIIGLAVRNGDCYIFEHSMTTPNENKVVPVVFTKTTQEDLVKSIKKI